MHSDITDHHQHRLHIKGHSHSTAHSRLVCPKQMRTEYYAQRRALQSSEKGAMSVSIMAKASYRNFRI